MLRTWSACVIGLSTVTVTGTVLPFSTRGGMSRITLPGRTGPSPAKARIAASISTGVPCAGRRTVIDKMPAPLDQPASGNQTTGTWPKHHGV